LAKTEQGIPLSLNEGQNRSPAETTNMKRVRLDQKEKKQSDKQEKHNEGRAPIGIEFNCGGGNPSVQNGGKSPGNRRNAKLQRQTTPWKAAHDIFDWNAATSTEWRECGVAKWGCP